MDFQKKIEAAEERKDILKNDVAEMVAMAEAEERDLSDSESLQLEAMSDEIDALCKRIADLEKAEKALGAQVVREKAAPTIVKAEHVRGFKERPKGDLIFKSAAVKFLAHVQRKDPLQVLQERYPNDVELDAVMKSAVSPAMTDVAGWAQELTDDALQGFQDLLRGNVAASDAFTNAGINLTFGDLTAIKIPNRQGTKLDLASSWSGEGDAIPVKRGTFGQIVIYPYKWGVISTFSKELAMRSNPQIEGLIRQFIVDDTGTQLDANFWSEAAAITGVRPAGVLEGVTGTGATPPAGDAAGEMTQDLRNLLDPILSADMGRNLRIYMHPSIALAMQSVLTATGVYLFRDELENGNLWGYPVITSTNLPVDEMFAMDTAELAVANSGMDFEASDTATLVEVNDDGVQPDMSADTHPRSPNSGQVGDAGDTVPASPVRSLYQTHTVGVKMTQYTSWHRMRTGMINRITGIAY